MVRRKRGNEQLLAFIKEKHAGESGIVYTSSRAKAETICAFLAAEGINCLCYHAGLSREQRELSQTRFLHEKDAVIVATIAFGMGIDKADVRFVAHTSLPKSIENYVQEIGRAGRDGQKAEAWLCFSGGDAFFQKKRIAESDAEDWYKNISEVKQDVMQGYAESTECRRNLLWLTSRRNKGGLRTMRQLSCLREKLGCLYGRKNSSLRCGGPTRNRSFT